MDLDHIRNQVLRSRGGDGNSGRFVRLHSFVDLVRTVGADLTDLARIARDVIRAFERIAEFIERKRDPTVGREESVD